MKIVEIEWIDAQSSLDFYTVEELKELRPVITKSCGYLVHKDKEKVILGFMLFGDAIKHHQIIPIGMVKKIKKVKKYPQYVSCSECNTSVKLVEVKDE